ncbi:hypothetical protein LT493_00650 [Streptomyces tricolor]|nr:hypothetical protein [Streptomyces tricolor]
MTEGLGLRPTQAWPDFSAEAAERVMAEVLETGRPVLSFEERGRPPADPGREHGLCGVRLPAGGRRRPRPRGRRRGGRRHRTAPRPAAARADGRGRFPDRGQPGRAGHRGRAGRPAGAGAGRQRGGGSAGAGAGRGGGDRTGRARPAGTCGAPPRAPSVPASPRRLPGR